VEGDLISKIGDGRSEGALFEREDDKCGNGDEIIGDDDNEEFINLGDVIREDKLDDDDDDNNTRGDEDNRGEGETVDGEVTVVECGMGGEMEHGLNVEESGVKNSVVLAISFKLLLITIKQ
jgi:hypothetical protein